MAPALTPHRGPAVGGSRVAAIIKLAVEALLHVHLPPSLGHPADIATYSFRSVGHAGMHTLAHLIPTDDARRLTQFGAAWVRAKAHAERGGLRCGCCGTGRAVCGPDAFVFDRAQAARRADAGGPSKALCATVRAAKWSAGRVRIGRA